MFRFATAFFLISAIVLPPAGAAELPDTVYELTVTGVTCKGCKKEVSDILTKLENVKAVEVDVSTGKTTITMNGTKTLDRATVDKAFKGTKFGVSSFGEKKSPESKPKN